jgi:D-inositol-3-phosphate glycosyltransferase
LNVDMVSEHGSPLAALGGADAGGQNVHVGALAVALARRGHDVVVYTRRDGPDLPGSVPLAPGVTVEHVPAGPARPVPKDDLLPYMSDFAAELSRRWMDRRPHIVHAHFWMSGIAALAGRRDPRMPIIQTFHALGSVKRRHQKDEDKSPRERIGLEAMIARDASAVIATCTEEVQELKSYGAVTENVFVVPCGVDAEHFRRTGKRAARDGDRRRVLTIGRLVPRKGVDTVIEALAHVPDAELVVVGGPARSALRGDPEVARLSGLAEDKGVADRVRFVGQVRHVEVPDLIRSSDVVVSVPDYEPFGIVPIEAMACGIPVIASAVGGHLDTVIDGVTGLHVPPRRPRELADRLGRLLADPALRRSLGDAAARHVHRRFQWPQIAVETEAVYLRAMAVGGGDQTLLAGGASS